MRISERWFDPHKVDGCYVLIFFTVSGKEHFFFFFFFLLKQQKCIFSVPETGGLRSKVLAVLISGEASFLGL